MADTKISALLAGAPVTVNDKLPIERSGGNFSVTAGNLLTYIQNNITGLTIPNGTTGQVLAKASNTSYDYVWTTINIPVLPLAISSGGTGSTSAAAARTALDIYSKAEVDALAGNVSDGAVTYLKLAAGVIGTTSDYTAGTASKVAVAANLAPLFYGCSVYQTATTSIPNNTWTTVAFDTELYDDNTWHDNVTNNSRITFNFTGRATVTANSVISGAGGGNTQGVRILLNGAVVGTSRSLEFASCVSVDLSVTSGDYVEMQVLQSSGSAQNTTTGTAGCCFSARRIR